MSFEGKIEGPIALVCAPSFAEANGRQGLSVFPSSLIDSLSEVFAFKVLRKLETMPIVYIKADAEELSSIDRYLEATYGDQVSVEISGTVRTDITGSPTLPSV